MNVHVGMSEAPTRGGTAKPSGQLQTVRTNGCDTRQLTNPSRTASLGTGGRSWRTSATFAFFTAVPAGAIGARRRTMGART